jgi:hypothetical protein
LRHEKEDKGKKGRTRRGGKLAIEGMKRKKETVRRKR